MRPIVWIGKGQVLARRGRRSAATPVIVRKSALAPNVPFQDLRVTRAHALWLDDVLIPVDFLVNHRSVLWDDHSQEVQLYHIELETHDVLLANGAPAESYRDDGNRWLFQNSNASWALASKAPCGPVVTGRPVVDAIWRRLLARSGGRPTLPLTDDPDLHLIADGVRVHATARLGEFMVFGLVGTPRSVRIVSRAGSPQELGLARDPRCGGRGVPGDCPPGRAVADDRGGRSVPDRRFRWTAGGRAPLPRRHDVRGGRSGPPRGVGRFSEGCQSGRPGADSACQRLKPRGS